MAPKFKQFGALIISIITSIAILASAWFGKGTEYENAWLYILCIGSILALFFDAYFKKKQDGLLKV